MEILNRWDEKIFFCNYWGKKPCLIRDVVESSFIKSLDINELSSLSIEEDIVSRIINFNLKSPDQIKLKHGPFKAEELTKLPQKEPWSLLIQDVDKKTNLFDSFLSTFSKIPSEYFDDIMASIGNLNSTTGPHLDWYSVFILQTNGSKNWKIEKNQRTYEEHDNSLLDIQELKILSNLNEHYEHELLPGEMLYIPPGHGHFGVSTSELSMSFSVGFQGPRIITLIETYLSNILRNIHEDMRVNYLPGKDSSINLENWPKEIEIKNVKDIEALIKLAKEQDY